MLATHCATCGEVAVYAGRTLLGNVNLRTATITLKVITSRKRIPIDGLGVSRT